jgi:alpha-L-arabinofuranosidase
VPQAPYFVYKLYADFWQELFCPANVTCGTIELSPMRKAEFRQPSHAALVAGASIDRKKTRVAVLLVNRALKNQTMVKVDLNGRAFTIRSAKLTLMSATPDAVNTAATPKVLGLKTVPVSVKSAGSVECVLPPCSVGMLFLDGRSVEEGLNK